MNNKSDRIIVIDAIKGFAALMIIIVHGVVFGIFDPDPAYYSQLLERLTVGLIITISPIMLMATWFTIFVFIAGMTITLAYLREMERGGENYKGVLKKKVINAISFVILGSIYGPILSHTSYSKDGYVYSLITGAVTTGGFVRLDVSRFFEHTIFTGIALCMLVFLGIVHPIFVRKEKIEKMFLIKMMIFCELLFVIFSFLLERIVEDSVSSGIMSSFFGGRHSMLPQLFFVFSGAIYVIIIFFSDDFVVRKHELLRFGVIRNLIYFIVFLIMSFFENFNYVNMIGQPELSVLFQFGNLAMMNFVIFLFFYFLELSERNISERRAKPLLYFAPLTMTLYCLESLFAAILKRIFLAMFGEMIFPWNGWVNILYMGVILIFWYLISRLWKKYNYIGSFEWILVSMMRVGGAKSNRLQVETEG